MSRPGGSFSHSAPGWPALESLLADLASTGCQSVQWLVHPSNRASIEFSRNVLAEADETQPPEDDPNVSFALAL